MLSWGTILGLCVQIVSDPDQERPMTLPIDAGPDSSILGAKVRDGGTNFAIWAPREEGRTALVGKDRRQTNTT